METLNSVGVRDRIMNLVSIASKDAKIELEAKLLSDAIKTRDQADRILQAIQRLSTNGVIEENRATFLYPDGIRVTILGPENIHKVCVTNSFRGVPLSVERKRRYSDIAMGVEDIYTVPDLKVKFTLQQEEPLRKDFTGSPMEASMIRIMNRKSWTTNDKRFRIDMSIVKSKTKQTKSLPEILKQSPNYELEIELLTKQPEDYPSLVDHIRVMLSAYQQSYFLLTESDIQTYRLALEQQTNVRFVNPVSMERRHLSAERENNILKGYTVTNKADGERCMLTVMNDRRLIRWNKQGLVAWTGLTAKDNSHFGDLIDGEYLPDRNLFCIFDIYRYKSKDTTRLPLIHSDEETLTTSRLGYTQLFVKELLNDFLVEFDTHPFRIETKTFYSGDGVVMEKAINRMLDTQFEYPTDGLIFTPKSSPVAPFNERIGDTWTTVYKWKPPHQNSIDFLLRLQPKETFDPVLDKTVLKGTLYVSRQAGTEIIYPCEMMTGEYTAPEVPKDLQQVIQNRVPSPFQPIAPKSFDAKDILVPVNNRGVPVDLDGNRVEDNTIVECVRDVESGRWKILRTRYDKTYLYRVAKKPNFGNDIRTANTIWTNIHNPVTEDMLRHAYTRPIDDTYEDDLYYRDKQESHDRNMDDVNHFHNKIKDQLYKDYVRQGDTLLELAVGRAGDLHKWRKTKPSLVVGIDYSRSNIEAPIQGACVRYIKTQKENPREALPPTLFIVGDMTEPIAEQDNKYIRILMNQEPPTTPYLEKFAGVHEFDTISCQFAIHYACASEETFRTFAKNLEKHGKGIFFGTCMDGQEVYSMLLGETGHIFRMEGTSNISMGPVWGEIRKEYSDGEEWHEEFGKAIVVKLENFEKPTREYLVPFGKVTEILAEHGYELIGSHLFRDLYVAQTAYTLEDSHKAFSYLHRTFAFKKVPVSEKAQTVEVPTIEESVEESSEGTGDKEKEKEPSEGTGDKESEGKASEEKPKKPRTKKLTKPKEDVPEPVIFAEGLSEYKEFNNSYDAPMEINGITYPTVEHYVQWKKAEKFGDAKQQEAIMKSKSALTAKQAGNKVKDVKEEEWNAVRDDIMRTALKAKIMQHPDIQEKLKSTGTRPIGEANARDKYWSIGTGADTNKTKNPDKWPGKNRLGELLQELRKELKE